LTSGPRIPDDERIMMTDHSPATPVIDVKTFWRILGQRALGSVVVTARGTDGPAGFLGLSATHLTADPPTMLVCIDKRTSALSAVLDSRHFALNYLPHEAAAVADSFGGRGTAKGADRFESGRWTTLKTGAPVLTDALAAVDCALEETIERHGVVVAFGRVVDVLIRADGEPLIHFRGGFR
jgi:flavin reductase (DIM6/NTAB) family NADH-FMN oxidoreductase RutF